MKHYIYHICRKSDTNQFKMGYIGITSNIQQRWKSHRTGKTNPHLKNALLKYDDVEFYIISTGSKEEMLRMERWLRPTPGLGWNCAEGGGLPPNLANHEWSDATNLKRSETMKRIDRVNYPSQVGKVQKTSKPFALVSPDGEVIEFAAVNSVWLKQHSLDSANIHGVLSGKRKQHKGWTGYYL